MATSTARSDLICVHKAFTKEQVLKIRKYASQKALAGDISRHNSLASMFVFAATPEGDAYWRQLNYDKSGTDFTSLMVGKNAYRSLI